MANDERATFLKWSISVGITDGAARRLLRCLPDNASLDPDMPCWIDSPTRVMALTSASPGWGIEKQLIDGGFIIIGSCPNGDPVILNIRDPELPVFYLSHEEIQDSQFMQVMAKVSGSIEAFRELLLDEKSEMPLDYWEAKNAKERDG